MGRDGTRNPLRSVPRREARRLVVAGPPPFGRHWGTRRGLGVRRSFTRSRKGGRVTRSLCRRAHRTLKTPSPWGPWGRALYLPRVFCQRLRAGASHAANGASDSCPPEARRAPLPKSGNTFPSRGGMTVWISAFRKTPADADRAWRRGPGAAVRPRAPSAPPPKAVRLRAPPSPSAHEPRQGAPRSPPASRQRGCSSTHPRAARTPPNAQGHASPKLTPADKRRKRAFRRAFSPNIAPEARHRWRVTGVAPKARPTVAAGGAYQRSRQRRATNGRARGALPTVAPEARYQR